MQHEYPLPDPLPADEIPEGWELNAPDDPSGHRTYENPDLDLFVYVYTDAEIVPNGDPVVGKRAWGVNLERFKRHPDHEVAGGDKEQQIAATSVQNRSVGSADDAANLHAVVRGYMELAERLDAE